MTNEIKKPVKKRTSNRAKKGQTKPNVEALTSAKLTAKQKQSLAAKRITYPADSLATDLKARVRAWTRPLASTVDFALGKIHFAMPNSSGLDSLSGTDAKVAFVARGGADSAIEFGARFAIAIVKRYEIASQLADTELAELVTECETLTAQLRAAKAAAK